MLTNHTKTITRLLIGSATAFATMWLVLWLMHPAWSHQAASGWVYPPECCSHSQDCQMAPDTAVQFDGSAYVVQLPAGHHRHAPAGGQWTFPLMFGSNPNNNIKQSGDHNYHICLGAAQGHPIKRCLYVRPGTV